MPSNACSVASCKSRYYNKTKQGREDLIFFRFPKNREIQKEWLRRCYRQDKINPRNRRICSYHFNPSDFEDEAQAKRMGCPARKLKKDAIPSLFLPTSEEDLSEINSQRKIGYLQKDKAIVEDKMTSVLQTPIDGKCPDSLEPLGKNTKTDTPFCMKNIDISQVASSSKESDLEILKRKMDELQNENARLREKMLRYENNEKNAASQMNSLDQDELKKEESKFKEEDEEEFKNEADQIIMPGCAAIGCPNSARKGFIMKRFPKDPKRRKQWADQLNRGKWSPTEWSALCEVHFSPEMWEKTKKDGIADSPLEINETTLSNSDESMQNAPELVKGEDPLDNDSKFSNDLNTESPKKVCRVCLQSNVNTISLLQLNPDDGRNINEVFQELLGETIEQIYHLKLPQEICDKCLFHLGHAYKFQKSYAKTLQKQNCEKDPLNITLCRICLDSGAELPFDLELTLDDGSTLNVVQVYQELTGETRDQIFDLTTPQRICENCPDSLVYAYQFKKALINSTQILGDSLLNTDSISEDEDESETKDILTNKEIDPLEDVAETLEEYEEILFETDDNSSIKNKIEENHIRLHSCPICFEKFPALELKQHCKSHDSLKKYFRLAPVFNKKIRFYAKPKNTVCLFYRDTILHTCPFCLKAFSGEDFRNHVRTHKGDGNFICKLCDRRFLGRNHLKRHQLAHKRETPFECEKCGKGFFLKKNYDFHQFHHSMPLELPFQCKHCSKSFANPEHLKRHNFTHEKSMTYKKYYPNKQNIPTCKKCQQKFKTQKELEDHKCSIICAKCLKPFANKKQLTNHGCEEQRLQFACRCGKEFKTLSACKSHRCKKRPKQLCSICGKEFTNMQQHLRTHNQQKSYSCDVCDKKFMYWESVLRHKVAVHRPPQTFSCQYCEKNFTNKIYMRNHEKIHTRKREHVCEICGAEFLYQVYLRRHQKVHKDTEWDW
ncbi:unnamed protein product [Ceutorhynchus assimilis]|uniref:C2H2-type domain-containing protein n=1 Tax=Ceutorhynchus assimilis TaxID=467358 RepID=A0A9N9QQP8_9CUCU|nr:unnamed protein product [Ceutorhynchus assimilis]